MVSRLGFFGLFGWGWSGGSSGAVGLDLLAWRNNLEETGSLESTSPLLNPAFQPASLPACLSLPTTECRRARIRRVGMFYTSAPHCCSG